eukprot:867223-Pelagomonas_calceolata.AAC.3
MAWPYHPCNQANPRPGHAISWLCRPMATPYMAFPIHASHGYAIPLLCHPMAMPTYGCAYPCIPWLYHPMATLAYGCAYPWPQHMLSHGISHHQQAGGARWRKNATQTLCYPRHLAPPPLLDPAWQDEDEHWVL